MSKPFDKHAHLKEIPHGAQFDDTEPGSVNIFVVAVCTIIFILVSIVGVYGYYSWFREKMIYERQLAPNSVDLTAIRTREDQLLNSYSYLEKDKGIVRLPISRAIELVMEESKDGMEKYPVAAKVIPPPTDPASGAAVVVPPVAVPAVPAAKH